MRNQPNGNRHRLSLRGPFHTGDRRRRKDRVAYLLAGLLLCGLIIIFQAGADAAGKAALSECKVIIDAGHGGFDPGAIGVATGVHEDEINLAVSKKLEAELKSRGIQVEMTRTDDGALGHTKKEDMQTRRDLITNSNADLAVIVHMNALNSSSVSGPMVIYYPGSIEGEKIASILQDTLNERLQPPKPKKVCSEVYYLLKSGPITCVIVECGFLSNPREEGLLQQEDYQQQIATAIADGVEAYLLEK